MVYIKRTRKHNTLNTTNTPREAKTIFSLNYRDGRPIYEQVKDGLRKLVVSGAISPDEKLPSIRELAVSLAINPNTIAKAYKELESEGYLYTVSGRGSFAASQQDKNAARKGELLQTFEKTVQELLLVGATKDELLERMGKIGEKD